MLRTESWGLRGRIDWALVCCALGLVLIGSIAILSAASPLPRYPQILQRHSLALALGVLAFLFGLGFNYQIFQDQSPVLYALTLVMLVTVLLVAEPVRGHRSWIRLPYFMFQPSEAARVCMILVAANYLDRCRTKLDRAGVVLGGLGLIAPILLLILIQPDFSSALLLFPIFLSMLFCAGASVSHILSIAGCGAVAAVLTLVWTLLSLHREYGERSAALAYLISILDSDSRLSLSAAALFAAAYAAHRVSAWLRLRLPLGYFMVTAGVLAAGLCSAVLINRHLKDYQRNRIVAFLAPEADPQEASYHVNQALVAIGSGGMVGKGIFSGTQSRLGFLPERHTDFVFAVVGEEMGFVGATAALGLYLMLIWRIVAAARLARDHYGFLVCSGLASMFAFYLLVNVGMCLGLLPVAGIPLLLVSYGGSSLVVSLWALGITMNVYSKRYAFI